MAQLLCKDKAQVASGLALLAPLSLRVSWQVADITRNPVFLLPVAERVVRENMFLGEPTERQLLFRAVVRLCTELKQPADRPKLVDLRRAAAVMALQHKLAIDLCALCKGKKEEGVCFNLSQKQIKKKKFVLSVFVSLRESDWCQERGYGHAEARRDVLAALKGAGAEGAQIVTTLNS